MSDCYLNRLMAPKNDQYANILEPLNRIGKLFMPNEFNPYDQSTNLPKQNNQINVQCKFGSNCTNTQCKYLHNHKFEQKSNIHNGSNWKKTENILCKFGSNCTNQQCKYIHDENIVCKFGKKCNRPDCKYIHQYDETSNNYENFVQYNLKLKKKENPNLTNEECLLLVNALWDKHNSNTKNNHISKPSSKKKNNYVTSKKKYVESSEDDESIDTSSESSIEYVPKKRK